MTDSDSRTVESPPMESEQARGIFDHLFSELPGVVYRCPNDREWTILGLTAPPTSRVSSWRSAGIRCADHESWT